MDIHISEEVRRTATNCKKKFSCLEEERKDLCKVENCIDGKVHFIKCLNDEYCPYKQSFGDSFFCSCPVRKEIFNKYNR